MVITRVKIAHETLCLWWL